MQLKSSSNAYGLNDMEQQKKPISPQPVWIDLRACQYYKPSNIKPYNLFDWQDDVAALSTIGLLLIFQLSDALERRIDFISKNAKPVCYFFAQ